MGLSMTHIAIPLPLCPPTHPIHPSCSRKVMPYPPLTHLLKPHQMVWHPLCQALPAQHLLVGCLQSPLPCSRPGRRKLLQLHPQC